MEDVDVSDLKQCLHCLVSVEKTDEDETYQGRVENVMQELSTLVLARPFKTGRPMTPEKYPLYVTAKDSIKIVERPISSTKTPKPKAEPKSTERFRDMMGSLKITPQKPKQQQQQPQRCTALELLNRAQSKQQQNGSKSPPQQPVVLPNGYQLLQRLKKSDSVSPQQQSPQIQQGKNNGGGPSGNPIMDFLNGHTRRGNHEFDQPINMHELNEDFDFCGNLALFKKEKSEDGYLEGPEELEDLQPEYEPDDYYRVVYEDKTAPNFRHDENIVSDPKRVNSWVNKAASKTKQYNQQIQQQQRPTMSSTPVTKKQNSTVMNLLNSATPSTSTPGKGYKHEQKQTPVKLNDNNGTTDEYKALKLKANEVLSTDNGAMLPLLRKNDKQNFLAATIRLYTESIYSCIVADRFIEYVFDLQKRLSLHSKDLLVIAGSTCDPILLHRFTQYFYNRNLKIHVYDPPQIPGNLTEKMKIYREVDELPTNFNTIYLLCPQTFHSDEELQNWILNIARPQKSKHGKSFPRLVALDFRVFDVKFMHTLYLGAVDESATVLRRQSNDSVLCTFEASVADLGTPYSWIISADSTPADAFRNSLFCRLNVN